MVGCRIRHKFIDGKEEQWYEGYVVDYNVESEKHQVVYNGESEQYFFNLVEDLKDNSLVVYTHN